MGKARDNGVGQLYVLSWRRVTYTKSEKPTILHVSKQFHSWILRLHSLFQLVRWPGLSHYLECVRAPPYGSLGLGLAEQSSRVDMYIVFIAGLIPTLDPFFRKDAPKSKVNHYNRRIIRPADDTISFTFSPGPRTLQMLQQAWRKETRRVRRPLMSV